MCKLEAQAVRKIFDNGGAPVEALHHISFTVTQNEFSVFLGPSGCGKSSLIRIIGGLEQTTSGNLLVEGRPVNGPGPERGVVFQTYTSFPWLTVEANIEFGLKSIRVPAVERNEIVRRWIESMGLTGFEKAYPSALSGGMRQRVAIARTLAMRPNLLLLDEPFAALDAQTRWDMQELLTNIWARHPTTVVFVTHDLREAVYLADRVFVMSPRPSTILKILKINLPRPRRREIMLSMEFRRLEAELFDLLASNSKSRESDPHISRRPAD